MIRVVSVLVLLVVGCSSDSASDVVQQTEEWDIKAESIVPELRQSISFRYSLTPELREVTGLVGDYRSLVIEGAKQSDATDLAVRKAAQLQFQDETSRKYLSVATKHAHFRFIQRNVAELMLRQSILFGASDSTFVFYLDQALQGLSSEFDMMYQALQRTYSTRENAKLAEQMLITLKAHQIVLSNIVNEDPRVADLILQEMGNRSSIAELLEGVSDLKASLELSLIN